MCSLETPRNREELQRAGGWGKWEDAGQRGQTSVYGTDMFWRPNAQQVMTIVNVSYSQDLPSAFLPHHTQKRQLCELMAMLIRLMVIIISQCVPMSNHHVVHFICM